MTLHTVTKRESEASEDESWASCSSESAKDTASRRMLTPVQRSSAACPHPPGFREVSSCVEKFSGKRVEDGTFKVWLHDFKKAITNCE